MTEPENKTTDVWVVRESDGKVVEIKADEIFRWGEGCARAITFYVNGDVVAQFFNQMSYYKKDFSVACEIGLTDRPLGMANWAERTGLSIGQRNKQSLDTSGD